MVTHRVLSLLRYGVAVCPGGESAGLTKYEGGMLSGKDIRGGLSDPLMNAQSVPGTSRFSGKRPSFSASSQNQ
jgi:hypothetical protein